MIPPPVYSQITVRVENNIFFPAQNYIIVELISTTLLKTRKYDYPFSTPLQNTFINEEKLS